MLLEQENFIQNNNYLLKNLNLISIISFIVFIFIKLKIIIILLLIFLIATIIIACVTLLERKLLSLVQRRVGPFEVGYRGRLQFIADAIKLICSGLLIPHGVNIFFFLICIFCSLWFVYIFFIAIPIGDNLNLIDAEYNILIISLFSIFFSFGIIIIGLICKNKYSLLSSLRASLLVFNLEILMGMFIIFLLILNESLNLQLVVVVQNNYLWFLYIFFPINYIIFIIFLLEVNRIPFDLNEAESELIAGYTNELSGFFFVLYYLGEYFHLVFFSLIYAITLLGGWYVMQYLFNSILIIFNTIDYNYEVIVLSFIMVTIILSLFFVKNLNYINFIFFLYIIMITIILCFYNLDFFASFVILLESSVILVLIVFIFYFNNDYKTINIFDKNFKNNIFNIFKYSSCIFFFFFFFKYNMNYINKNYFINYYDLIYDTNKNDFNILFNVFYKYNYNIILLIFFFILLISVIIINLGLYKLKFSKKTFNKLFKFIKTQNFIKQTKHITYTHFFNK